VSDTHPVIARYLAHLEAELATATPADRAEIVDEIRDHCADAIASGRSADEVLAALGSAEALARAYAVERALQAPGTRLSWIDRALTVIGLLAVASLPSFIVSVVLLAVGVACAAAGVGVFAGGVAELVRPGTIPDLTVSPWVCLAIGPPLAAVGVAALVALYLYLRFLTRLTLQTLRRVRHAHAG
jgi:uncharacterized membrane protein